MPKFIVVFTRPDTLDSLPNETIELDQEIITMSELMKVVELRRRELSKMIGFEALFAALVNESGQVLNYNAHNF